MAEEKDERDISISQIVKAIAEDTPANGLTVAELLERIGNEGLLVTIMVLTVPFLLPVSIPGTSIPFGILIMLICRSLMTDTPVRLPRRLSRIRLRRQHMVLIAVRAAAIFERLEKVSKPRLELLTKNRLLRNVHIISIVINSFCLMLPLPLPFSNTIPAYGVVFLALGLLRRDGVMIIFGYVALIAILVYLAIAYTLGVLGIQTLLK